MSMDWLHGDESRAAIRTQLLEQILVPMREQILTRAAQLAGPEATEKHVLQTAAWLAYEIEDAASTNTTLFLAYSDLAGGNAREIAHAVGQHDGASVKRKYPHLDRFKSVVTAVRVTGQKIMVQCGRKRPGSPDGLFMVEL